MALQENIVAANGVASAVVAGHDVAGICVFATS
jgi:hypothetical protein